MDLSPLRLATPVDHDAVVALVHAAYKKYIPRIGREPRPMTADYVRLIGQNYVYVLENEGRLTAVLVLWREGDAIMLDNIAISPDAQGRGLGRQLLEWVERFTRDAGLNTVDLYTNEKMVENIAIYTHLGYVETERYHGEGFSRVSMRKQLPPV